MAVDIEDDELEQEEEDKDKPRPKPQAIGNPIAPAPASTGDSGRFQDVRPIMPQPAQTTTPTPYYGWDGSSSSSCWGSIHRCSYQSNSLSSPA